MKKKKQLLIYPLMLMGLFLMLTNSCKKDEKNDDPEPTTTTVTDIDGNVYNTVTIGTQVWMVENLKVTKYNDGTAIPLVTTTWVGLLTPAYCYYDNDEAMHKNTYGALYNWYAVNTGKLCPTGWHVPSAAEWTTLINYLGGESVAGGKLRETGTDHWQTPNTGATNESGFTALPGGMRNIPSNFYNIWISGIWWSSTEYDATDGYLCRTDYNYSSIIQKNLIKTCGFSVRCLKD